MNFSRRLSLIAIVTSLFMLFFLPARHSCNAQESNQSPDLSAELKKLNLNQLMDIEVISVSKKPEKLSQSAAAIFVITQEDIRRSGATSFPELLRMVPGIQVARQGSDAWQISSRGLSGTREAGLLIDVRLDGCSLATDNLQAVDIVLGNIERIEVIRGPTSSIWGTKAVSGLINIITKHAKDTQGGLVTGAIGSGEEGYSGMRYGVKLKEGVYCRVDAKYQQFGTVDDAVHIREPENKQGTFRLDWDVSSLDRLMFSGSYGTHLGESFDSIEVGDFRWPKIDLYKSKVDVSGSHLMGRWEHTFSSTSDMVLKFYYDQGKYTYHDQGDDINLPHNINYSSYDIDFQHRFNLLSWNAIVWGAEIRVEDNTYDKFPSFSINPRSRIEPYYSGFLQNEIPIIQNRLVLTLGSKFEYNSFCFFQAHPSARLLWTPHPQHTFWLAVSRAARTDLRIEHDINYQVGTMASPGDIHLLRRGILEVSRHGNLDPEELVSYEAGYRVQPGSVVTLDLTAFANYYHHFMTSTHLGYAEWHPRYFIAHWYFESKMHGKSCSVEAVATWQAAAWWKLQSSYTYLNYHFYPGEHDTGYQSIKDLSPRNQYTLRSLINITRQIEFDTNIYFTSRIRGQDLPSYTNLILRLGWKPMKGLELALIVANLLKDHHVELLTAGKKNEIQRSVLGKITWTF